MLTKYKTAMKVAAEGISVYIANGKREGIVSSIISGRDVPFTHFPKSGQRVSAVRKWISNSESFAAGAVTVNQGARDALLSEKATSLLMVGITSVEGSFRKGDIISILDETGVPMGLGKSEFDSVKAAQSIGLKGKRHLVHYHNLIINERQTN
jgi:glutamate 5-kinase